MSSKMPERSSLPLAVQLSATPPAIAKRRSPSLRAKWPHKCSIVRSRQACSDAAVGVGDFFLRAALFDQTLRQMSARPKVVLALILRLVQTQNGNANPPIGAQFDRFIKERAEAFGVPIRRQTHDFVLVSVEIESEVERDK